MIRTLIMRAFCHCQVLLADDTIYSPDSATLCTAWQVILMALIIGTLFWHAQITLEGGFHPPDPVPTS